jgi:hypothetical protein
MTARRLVPLVAFLALSSPMSAHADAPDGMLRAIACGKVEGPLQLEISLEDDGRSSVQIERRLAAELKQRQAEVSAGAPLRLSLSIHTVRAHSRGRRPDLGRFSHDTDRGTQVQFNLWSNQHDSVFGGRREDVAGRHVDELRIEISINDKSNGRCVWHGQAAVDLDGRDADQAALRIIPLLVARIGETVRGEPITLD